MKKNLSPSFSFPDAAAVHAYLEAMPMFQKTGPAAARFGLDGIRQLCEGLGNPQQNLPCIHVAGTNGKGSVCQMLRAVYSRAGYRTGCFTSPHLLRYNERITLNGQEIPDAELLVFFRRYSGLIREVQPSYFELATGIAFWYFARQKVDLAIIETGLGGRLDSTNIIQPMVSIITSIGFDHTDVLGHTLAEIAAEKAGIIKKNAAVVTGNLPAEAQAVMQAAAARQQTPLFRATSWQPEYLEGGHILLRQPDSGAVLRLQTGFHQAVQRYNAAMVLQTTALLENRLPVAASGAAKGIEEASYDPGFRARFEQLLPGRACYYDGAHNPEAFAEALGEVQKKAAGADKILVFSIMRDKLNDKMISLLSEFDEIYYFESSAARSVPFREIAQILPDVKRFNDQEWLSLATRLNHATHAAPGNVPGNTHNQPAHASASSVSSGSIKPAASAFVLFSGSLYFYGYITELLMRSTPELVQP